MCGLSGKLNFDRHQPVDPALLRQMTDLLAHRGPDGRGEYLFGPIALGHRRLSIIDLETGAQPMSNEDGTVWVVFNGEIYNFRELRKELEGQGHIFRSSSDTEVIVHLYEQIGDRCVDRLRGMFAFALWDARRYRLLLARDHVGIKPLYFANTGKSLIFASEIKSLLADPELARTVNLRSLDRFLSHYYLPGQETLLEGIFKLAPGSTLTVEDGAVKTQPFWDLRVDGEPRSQSFDEAVGELRELLSRSIEAHMVSDVPVGILLSGGVDSTGILAYAAHYAQRPLHTFTMGFAGQGFADERPYARLASTAFSTVHHEISMSAEDFRDFLPRYVWHMEEPVCEPPAVALYFVSALARDASIKVLLSGEGGDEAFGGYSDYRNLLLLERLKDVFGKRSGLLRHGFEVLAKAGWTRGSHYAALVDRPLQDYYYSRTAGPTTPFNRLKSSLYSADLRKELGDGPAEMPTQKLFAQVADASRLARMLYVDTRTWLPDDLLVKADKMTMAASVELRVPLLDVSILEFAASLPAQFKVDGWKLKRILKAALAPSIPSAIIKRKKTGFPVPYGEWMRTELKPFVFDTLLASDAATSAYFSPAAVRRLLQTHQEGRGCSKEVFSLLVLELWLRKFTPLSGLCRTGHSPSPERTQGSPVHAPAALDLASVR